MGYHPQKQVFRPCRRHFKKCCGVMSPPSKSFFLRIFWSHSRSDPTVNKNFKHGLSLRKLGYLVLAPSIINRSGSDLVSPIEFVNANNHEQELSKSHERRRRYDVSKSLKDPSSAPMGNRSLVHREKHNQHHKISKIYDFKRNRSVPDTLNPITQ